MVEHSLGKGEVAGPIPAKGTRFVYRRRYVGGALSVVDLTSLLFGVR